MTEKGERSAYTYYQMFLDLNTIDEGLRQPLLALLKGMEKTIKIREFQEKSDMPSFLRIVNRSFLDAPDPYERVVPTDLDEISEDRMIFIASLYGKDVGAMVVLLDKEPYRDELAATISLLAVIPERKHHGVGTTMAIHAYDWLRSHHIRYLKCLVGKDNLPSYRFMTRLGFKKYGQKEFSNE